MDRLVTLKELMDLDNETYKRNNTFGKYAKLLDDYIDPKSCHYREPKAKSMVKFIIKRFWHHVITDIIKNNVEFVFPYHVFYFSIRSRSIKSKKYKFNIETQGHDYIPYVLISEKKKNILRRAFTLRLYGKYKDMLLHEISRGHKYEDASITYYK